MHTPFGNLCFNRNPVIKTRDRTTRVGTIREMSFNLFAQDYIK
jgi:hypothetical protein